MTGTRHSHHMRHARRHERDDLVRTLPPRDRFPFFGPERWSRFYGSPQKEEGAWVITLDRLVRSLPELEERCHLYPGDLKALTHAAFAGVHQIDGIPLTYCQAQLLWDCGKGLADESWVQQEYFAIRQTCHEGRVHIFPIDPFAWCENKSLEEQRDCVKDYGYEQSTLAIEACKFLALQKMGFGSVYRFGCAIQCADRAKDGTQLLFRADGKGFRVVRSAPQIALGLVKLV